MRRAARVAAACLAGAVLAAGPASADRREDLEALRQAIEESRERVDDYERRQRGLLEAVEALDRAAALLSRDVAAARRAAREAGQALVAIEAEARELERRLEATRRAMQARAVALYRAGELGAVRLLFSAGGLREFLSRVYALRRLLDHDAELLARYRRQSAALEAVQERARETAAERTAAERRLEQRSAQLGAERLSKRKLVARLHEDRARERAALVELEKAARALEETLAALGEEPGPVGAAPSGPPFVALRRHLAPPVDAPVVSDFGRVVDAEYLTETFRSGIVFDAPTGRPVEAVAAGRVRFAGWFRGYGNLVILDHGDSYFSVSGHLDGIGVEVGQSVAARQVIGTVGETGSLAGPRLYFEIRRGGEALDPGDWLRSRNAR